VNRADYEGMVKNQGLRNSWNDSPKYIIIGSTASGKNEMVKKLLSEENFNKIDQGQIYLGNIENDGKIFYCGCFEIKGAHGKRLMLSMIDQPAVLKPLRELWLEY